MRSLGGLNIVESILGSIWLALIVLLWRHLGFQNLYLGPKN